MNDPLTTLPPFFEAFNAIKKHLGPVLIQLPPNLGFHPEKADPFFSALKKYKGYTFAVEPRHSSWMEKDAIQLLKKYEIGFVIAESGGRFPSGDFTSFSVCTIISVFFDPYRQL